LLAMAGWQEPVRETLTQYGDRKVPHYGVAAEEPPAPSSQSPTPAALDCPTATPPRQSMALHHRQPRYRQSVVGLLKPGGIFIR